MTVETQAPIQRTITAIGGQVAISVNGLGNVGLAMTLTGVTAGQFAFEASLDSTDGVNGTWFAIPGVRSNAAAAEIATGALSATPAYGWQFNVVCYNYFRVRATAGTFGTTTVIAAPGERVPAMMNVAQGALAAAAQLVQGAAGRGVNSTNNPVLVGATGRAANLAAIVDGRPVDLWADLQGKLVVKMFAPNELDWQATMASDGATITTATTTALIAAVATYRRYVTAIQLHNSSATATEVVLQDTTGTPAVLWRGFLPANMTQPYNVEFPSPLRTGSGTASGIGLRAVTAGANIRWSIQGYAGY